MPVRLQLSGAVRSHKPPARLKYVEVRINGTESIKLDYRHYRIPMADMNAVFAAMNSHARQLADDINAIAKRREG